MIRVARTQQWLASRARVAQTVAERMVGLLGRTGLEAGEGLVLPGCHSIHTVGMRFPIDVIFVDRQWRVVALRSAYAPGRLIPPVWRAWAVWRTCERSPRPTSTTAATSIS